MIYDEDERAVFSANGYHEQVPGSFLWEKNFPYYYMEIGGLTVYIHIGVRTQTFSLNELTTEEIKVAELYARFQYNMRD